MRKTILFASLLLLAATAMAVPAYTGKVLFNQPGRDGVSVTIQLMGDERVHWAETEDGYSLVHADDGSLVYAMLDGEGDMVASEFLATEVKSRPAEVSAFLAKTDKHLRFSQRQIDEMLKLWRVVEESKNGPKAMSDVLGSKKFLVILFAFQDQSFHYGKNQFKMLFNQLNYTTGGRTGSVHEYYREVSDGLLSLFVDVVGPYTGTENTAYYGDSDWGYQEFALEAVSNARKDVDFSDYDNDGDGYIDGLHIIFAGHGEEAGASSDAIWSHKWNIFNPLPADSTNNTVVDVYSCSPELSGNTGTELTNIGVICHELGHVMGAPDYYDTDYGGSGGEFPGLGQWDIMSSGSWNRGGMTPAHHNPYTKIYIYHWASCDTIDATPGTYSLRPVDETNSDFLRVNTGTSGDFFLIENRQKIKWDKGIPSHGMLVYHVHPSAYGASVSNAKHPQQIYIIAGGTSTNCPNSSPSSYGSVNSDMAVLPTPYGLRDSLTDNSVPWFRPWSGDANGVPITNISEGIGDNRVYFTINQSPLPTSASAMGVSSTSVLLDWNRYASFNTLIVMVPDGAPMGTPDKYSRLGDTLVGGGIVVYRGDGSHCRVDNLNKDITYRFRLFAYRGNNNNPTFGDGVDVTAKPLDCDGTAWYSEDFETATLDELPPCWQGSWLTAAENGQQVLASPVDATASARQWVSVISRPITWDTTADAVLKFKMHFTGNSSESTLLRTDYNPSDAGTWQMMDTATWHFGMATWQTSYVQLLDAGAASFLRFAVYTDATDGAAIDDVELQEGWLVEAGSNAYGSITPSGNLIVAPTDTTDFALRALPHSRLESLTLDGTEIALSELDTLEDGALRYRYFGHRGAHRLQAIYKAVNSIENGVQNAITVFPNPATETLTVRGAEGLTVELYDRMGRRVMDVQRADNEQQMDVSNLRRGVYILRAGNCVRKVVKQ